MQYIMCLCPDCFFTYWGGSYSTFGWSGTHFHAFIRNNKWTKVNKWDKAVIWEWQMFGVLSRESWQRAASCKVSCFQLRFRTHFKELVQQIILHTGIICLSESIAYCLPAAALAWPIFGEPYTTDLTCKLALVIWYHINFLRTIFKVKEEFWQAYSLKYLI